MLLNLDKFNIQSIYYLCASDYLLIFNLPQYFKDNNTDKIIINDDTVHELSKYHIWLAKSTIIRKLDYLVTQKVFRKLSARVYSLNPEIYIEDEYNNVCS